MTNQTGKENKHKKTRLETLIAKTTHTIRQPSKRTSNSKKVIKIIQPPRQPATNNTRPLRVTRLKASMRKRNSSEQNYKQQGKI